MSLKGKGFRHLVRVQSTDIEGQLPVSIGITRVPGINRRLAHTISRLLDIDLNERIGFLTDAKIKEIEAVISNPLKSEIPVWMLNRCKDRASGEDIHLTQSQLALAIKQDIEHYIKLRSRRGIRHQLSLKVRGQKTRTHGGRGSTVGVSKKKR